MHTASINVLTSIRTAALSRQDRKALGGGRFRRSDLPPRTTEPCLLIALKRGDQLCLGGSEGGRPSPLRLTGGRPCEVYWQPHGTFLIAFAPTSSRADAVGAAFGAGTGLIIAGPPGAMVGGVIGAIWGRPFWGPPDGPGACWTDHDFHRHCRHYTGSRW